MCYFNPRPPRGGRRNGTNDNRAITIISIHAPREGGDVGDRIGDFLTNISIHAPREGGDRYGNAPFIH